MLRHGCRRALEDGGGPGRLTGLASRSRLVAGSVDTVGGDATRVLLRLGCRRALEDGGGLGRLTGLAVAPRGRPAARRSGGGCSGRGAPLLDVDGRAWVCWGESGLRFSRFAVVPPGFLFLGGGWMLQLARSAYRAVGGEWGFGRTARRRPDVGRRSRGVVLGWPHVNHETLRSPSNTIGMMFCCRMPTVSWFARGKPGPSSERLPHAGLAEVWRWSALEVERGRGAPLGVRRCAWNWWRGRPLLS